MKRIFLVVILAAVMFGVMLYFCPKPFEQYADLFPANSTACIYCRKTSLPSTNVGNGFLVTCALADLQQTLDCCDGVDGLSVRFCGTAEDFLKYRRVFGLQVSEGLQLDGLTVVCGNSDKICGGVWLGGNFVNVQMAFDGQTVTVGYPLILDSY